MSQRPEKDSESSKQQSNPDEIKELLFQAMLSEYKLKPNQAEKLYLQALQLSQELAPVDKSFVLSRVCVRLADFYLNRENFLKAAEYFEMGNQAERFVLQGERLKLASSLYQSGKIEQGLKEFRAIYDSCYLNQAKKYPAFEHMLASWRAGLSCLYLKNARKNDARKLYETAIESLKELKLASEEEMRAIIELKLDLCRQYKKVGMLEEATESLHEVLSEAETTLGVLDPASCHIRFCLCQVLLERRKSSAAERFYARLLREAVQPLDKVNVLCQSASFHAFCKKEKTAKTEISKAIKLCGKIENCPEGMILFLQTNLLRLLEEHTINQKRLAKIRAKLNEIGETQKQMTSESKDDAYFEFRSRKQNRQAEQLCISEIESDRSKSLDEIDRWYSRLAQLYADERAFKKAIAVYTKQRIWLKNTGMDQQYDFAELAYSLGKAYAEEGEFDKLEKLYDELLLQEMKNKPTNSKQLEIRVHSFVSESTRPASRKNDLAQLYFEHGQLTRAEALILESLNELERAGFASSKQAILLNLNLARVYLKQDRPADAERVLKILLAQDLKSDFFPPEASDGFAGFSYSGLYVFASSDSSLFHYKNFEGRSCELPVIRSSVKGDWRRSSRHSLKDAPKSDQLFRFQNMSAAGYADLKLIAEKELLRSYKDQHKVADEKRQVQVIFAFITESLKAKGQDAFRYESPEMLLEGLPEGNHLSELRSLIIESSLRQAASY